MMPVWRELLLNFLLLGSLSMTAGAVSMILHGLLVHRRQRGDQPLFECVTRRAWALGVVAFLFTLLLLTQAGAVPWDWIGTLVLLIFIAPLVLTWLGPPDEHLELCNLCQIGKGSAYNHYFGYLRLMQGPNRIRSRLEAFQHDNPSGLSEGDLQQFYSKAVVVLAPTDGHYPSNFEDLEGVDKKMCEMPKFKCAVGGNKRSYGGFGVFEVISSDGRHRNLVALDKVGALGTLSKLRQHGPAGLSHSDCTKQMEEMMDELEKIVENSTDLRGQLKVVRYGFDHHVGDAIMTAIHGRD